MSRRRRLAWIAAAALVATLAVDLRRAPREQVSARVLLAGIGLYRATLSPYLAGTGVSCRFYPSCSRYAEVSIRRHGALAGSLRAVRRVARCGPWTARGTVDPT